MATKSKVQQHYLTGSCKWAKLNPPGDEEFEQYAIAFFPDEPSLKIMEGLNLKSAQRKDNKTGEIYYNVARKFKNAKGEDLGLVHLYPSDGPMFVDERPSIVNGSKVTIKVISYPIPKSNYQALRLDSVRIDEMAEHVAREETVDLPF
jgi:hypothetical protein